MRLPIYLLQEIIGHPVSHFSGKGQKRAMGRVCVETDATVYPINGDFLDAPFPVMLHDISAETVGVICSRALMPRTNMVISIPRSDESGDAINVTCRVARCSRDKDGQFHLAAQFVEVCDLEKLLSKTKSES